MIPLLLIWLLFGFICYWLAKKQGRDKKIAFVAGFFLGVLALIYYLIAGEVKQTCQFCKEKMKKGAIVCPHCQREVNVIKK